MNNQGRTQLQSIVEGLKQQSAKEAQASRDVQDRTKKEFHDTQMQLSHAMNRADDLDKEVKRLTVKLAEQNKVRVSGVQYHTVFFLRFAGHCRDKWGQTVRLACCVDLFIAIGPATCMSKSRLL